MRARRRRRWVAAVAAAPLLLIGMGLTLVGVVVLGLAEAGDW